MAAPERRFEAYDPATGPLKTAAPFARRLALGCILPAALTPRADWHERWKHVTAAAGAIAGISSYRSMAESIDTMRAAETMVNEVYREFCGLCAELEAAEDSRAAEIWAQRDELIKGLAKRVSERLGLLQCADIDSVAGMLQMIAERRAGK